MNTLLWLDIVLHAATIVAAIRVIWLFGSDRIKIKDRMHRLEDRVMRCEQSCHLAPEDDAARPVTLHLVTDEDKSA